MAFKIKKKHILKGTLEQFECFVFEYSTYWLLISMHEVIMKAY